MPLSVPHIRGVEQVQSGGADATNGTVTRVQQPAWRAARDLVARALATILGRYGARTEWAQRLHVSRQRLDRWTEPGDTSCPTLADVLLMPDADRRELLRVLGAEGVQPEGTEAHRLLLLAGRAGGLVSAVAHALADARVDDAERAALLESLDLMLADAEAARAALKRGAP